MRSAAPWRSRRTRPVSSFAPSMPARDRRCAPRAPRPTANSTSARSAAVLETQPNLQAVPAGGRRPRPCRAAASIGCVTASGIEFDARSIVLTVGTFLGGRIHVGLESHAGGRAGDPPSNRLAARLRELPLRVGRLKTGTPPRIDGRSIDYRRLARAAQRRAAPGVLVPGHARACIRGSCPATSPPPTSAPTTSFAARPHARPCSRD